MRALDAGVVGGFGGVLRVAALSAMAALVGGAAPAHAAVVSVVQALGNGQYAATLRDDALVNWEGADLQVHYVAALTFLSGTVGDLDPANFGVAFTTPLAGPKGDFSLQASITHGLADAANGDAVILRLLFSADPAALPLSKNIISFATADDTLYDFVTTSASLGGTAPSVPEGSSAALAATALLALWASRRPRLR